MIRAHCLIRSAKVACRVSCILDRFIGGGTEWCWTASSDGPQRVCCLRDSKAAASHGRPLLAYWAPLICKDRFCLRTQPLLLTPPPPIHKRLSAVPMANPPPSLKSIVDKPRYVWALLSPQWPYLTMNFSFQNRQLRHRKVCLMASCEDVKLS